jgi:hypothetical protein
MPSFNFAVLMSRNFFTKRLESIWICFIHGFH